MYSREDLKICPVSDNSLLSDLTEIFFFRDNGRDCSSWCRCVREQDWCRVKNTTVLTTGNTLISLVDTEHHSSLIGGHGHRSSLISDFSGKQSGEVRIVIGTRKLLTFSGIGTPEEEKSMNIKVECSENIKTVLFDATLDTRHCALTCLFDCRETCLVKELAWQTLRRWVESCSVWHTELWSLK